jgi:hypothetical protein
MSDHLNGVTPDPRALQTFEEWFEWLTKKNGQSYEKTDPIYQWAELAWNWRLKLTPAAQLQTQWIPTLHKDGTTTVEPRQFYEESGTITKEQFGNLLPPEPTVLVEALERLSVLGNAPYPGTSEGNMIAREALAEYRGER